MQTDKRQRTAHSINTQKATREMHKKRETQLNLIKHEETGRKTEYTDIGHGLSK